jgi:hypothetical protein
MKKRLVENPLKNSLIALALLGLVINCSDDPEVEDITLVGRWQLIEVLNDPGDLSGTFEPVDSDKYIEFLLDGEVRSNGNLCSSGGNMDNPSSGNYILPDSILSIDDCPRPYGPTLFRIENGNLILSYPCIEPCEEKYSKNE